MRLRFITQPGLYGYDRTVQVFAPGRDGIWYGVATYCRLERGRWECRTFPFDIETSTEPEMRRLLRAGLADRDALIETELARHRGAKDR